MKYLLLAIIILVACSPIVDRRSDAERAATRTARAMLIPPLPHTIRVRLNPYPTVTLPTVTPAKGAP